MLHTNVADWAALKLYEAIMAFYNPAAKEAILYYAQVMAGPGAINLLFMLSEWVGWMGKRRSPSKVKNLQNGFLKVKLSFNKWLIFVALKLT